MSEPKVKVKRVLFFDSGVGGLSILREVEKLNPEIESYYLFDNECFPYGNKSDVFIIKRVRELLSEALSKFELSAVVIACNTASTIVLNVLREFMKIPVVGVVPAIKPAAQISKNKIIGLLATPGTISREYTKNLIRDFASDCEVIKIGDANLAVIAENRLSTGHVHSESIAKIIRPFTQIPPDERPDTVVLGCTHYPLLRSTIGEIMGEAVRLVNPAYETALELKRLLTKEDLLSQETKQEEFPYRFYVSDLAEKFKQFANSILPYDVEMTQKIDIEKYESSILG